MKNSTILMYYLSIIGTFLGMIIHIRYMVDTSKPIHLLCFLLWLVINICMILLFRHELRKN